MRSCPDPRPLAMQPISCLGYPFHTPTPFSRHPPLREPLCGDGNRPLGLSRGAPLRSAPLTNQAICRLIHRQAARSKHARRYVSGAKTDGKFVTQNPAIPVAWVERHTNRVRGPVVHTTPVARAVIFD